VTNLDCDNQTAVIEDDGGSDVSLEVTAELSDGDIEPNDTSVCASNNKTYSSICHLLQNTFQQQVKHAGRCNSIRCRGGRVSYTNITQ
jgi:reversion-inducing cysteine-rich kazal motif protein